MKNIVTIIAGVLITVGVLMPWHASAQVPQKMNYQAVIRNNNNALITLTAVGMRISILQGSSVGNAVYVETQMPITNANGLASIEIGSGTVVSGNFSTINWAVGPYFIKTETDPTGGVNYTIIGTSELTSVPYALFSGNASNGEGNYWTLNSGNIFNSNNGNVGIGTNKPTTKLTVETAFNSKGWMHIGRNGTDSIVIGDAIGGVSAAFGVFSNHILRLTAGELGKIQLLPTGEAIVGDNFVAPFGRFTVRTPNNSYGISHTSNEGNILATNIGGTSAGIGTFSNTNMRIFCNSSSRIFIAAATGNVGIGTDNPTHKLSVLGSIRSTEMVVETGWADYVFDENYKLNSLDEVEKFIQQNKRLPNIPSAKDVEEKGLHLGEVQKRMMEKIEELTLYIIQQQKEIDAMKKLVYKNN